MSSPMVVDLPALRRPWAAPASKLVLPQADWEGGSDIVLLALRIGHAQDRPCVSQPALVLAILEAMRRRSTFAQQALPP